MALVDGGLVEFWRCRQRGAAGRVWEQGGRVVDQFYGGGEDEAHRKNELGEVWSAGEEQWWSAAHGAGRSYTTARCSGCGRGDRRGARARCLWWLSDGEQGGAGVVKVTE
jgi:hypothetical protein